MKFFIERMVPRTYISNGTYPNLATCLSYRTWSSDSNWADVREMELLEIRVAQMEARETALELLWKTNT